MGTVILRRRRTITTATPTMSVMSSSTSSSMCSSGKKKDLTSNVHRGQDGALRVTSKCGVSSDPDSSKRGAQPRRQGIKPRPSPRDRPVGHRLVVVEDIHIVDVGLDSREQQLEPPEHQILQHRMWDFHGMPCQRAMEQQR